MRLRGSREPKAVTLSVAAVCCCAAAAASCLHYLRRVPTYKDRQAKEGATRHEGCAVPPNEINDNLLAAVPWLGLPSPHLSLPTVDLGRERVSLCISVSLLLCTIPRLSPIPSHHNNKVQTPHRGPPLPSHPSPTPPSSLLLPTNTTITITTTTTGRHYSLTRTPSLMPSLLVPPRSSPDAAQRHSARS